MRFWDTSAIVPLLFEEEESGAAHALFESDPGVVGHPVECASAAARLRREGELTVAQEDAAVALLATLREGWVEILPSEELRIVAHRLLRVHPLGAAAALQLAAAVVWAGKSTGSQLVTLDERLAMAARLEGLVVLPA